MSLSSGGKHTKQNKESLKQLKQEYLSRGYTDPPTCEIRFPGCVGTFTCGFAHKHHRIWYYPNPELLRSFQETVLACTKCHNKIENNEELRKSIFKKLRP